MNASNFALPAVVLIILLAGWMRRVPLFDTFLEGAKEGLSAGIAVLPPLVALMVGVGVLRASGALDMLSFALTPVAALLGIPREVLPLTLMRPITGSGALAVFTDIIRIHGPDSPVGRVASVIQGSTETTFYTIAVYYGATRVRRTRQNLPACLTADLVGFVMSAAAVRLLLS
jgi:spore maturation protein B